MHKPQRGDIIMPLLRSYNLDLGMQFYKHPAPPGLDKKAALQTTNSTHSESLQILIQTINAEGGLGKMWQLFGEETESIIQELNEALAA
jgi:hypothetical protein